MGYLQAESDWPISFLHVWSPSALLVTRTPRWLSFSFHSLVFLRRGALLSGWTQSWRRDWWVRAPVEKEYVTDYYANYTSDDTPDEAEGVTDV